MLDEKMQSLIMSKERKGADLTSVSFQISTLLRELQPDSNHTFPAPGSSLGRKMEETKFTSHLLDNSASVAAASGQGRNNSSLLVPYVRLPRT